MSSTSIDPGQFVRSVQPLLESQDLKGLLCLLKAKWEPGQILALLRSEHEDARKVALLALGLVGGKCCIGDLSQQLRDPDPMVNQMAEHALWSIWFRGSSIPEANQELCKGTRCLDRRDFDCAFRHFDRALELDPDFAEAYNQRAIAHYLNEHWDQSIQDCKRVVKRMPCHFGAWAGIGHCQAHLGRSADAIASYQKALEINPHLDCIRETVAELRRRLDN